MSFAKLLSPLKGEHFELRDVRLHQYAGDKPGSLEGEVYYDPTLHVPKIALNGSHAALLAEPTVAPPTLVVGQAPSIGTSLKGMRSDAKMGLPGVATGAAHGFMSSTDKAKLDAATTTPTADALAKYDASGRLIVSDAVSGQQAVNWQTMVAQIALAQQGLAEKDPCRGLFTSLPANTYNAGTKRITASANGALAATPDGVGSWQVNDRIFFVGTIGTGSAQAGPYMIVQVGSASLPFILERTADFGGPGAPAGQRMIGALIQVLEGSEHGDSFWVCANDSITLDTTVLVFRKQAAADVDNSTIELDAAGNMRVKDGGVTYAKIQNGGALSVPGRSANSAGVLADISATADGQVLRRSGTTLGFGTVANAGLDNMAQSTIKGRASGAGTGVPTDLTAAQVRTILNVADGANAYVHPNHSGDVASVGDGITTIQPGVVTNAKAANMATATIKGRASAGTGSPEDLTPAQARSVIGIDGAEGINRALKVVAAAEWVKIATLTVTVQYAVQSILVDVLDCGSESSATDRGSLRVHARLKQQNPMSSALDFIQVDVEKSGFTSLVVGHVVDQDNASAKIVSIWVTSSYSTLIRYSVIAKHGAPQFFENQTPTSIPVGLIYSTSVAKTLGSLKLTALAGTGTRKAVIGPDGTIQAGDSTTESFRVTIGNGSATSFTLAHGLGTADLMCQFIEVATGAPVGIEHYIDATNIVVQPGVVLPTNSLRVLAWKV